MPAKKNIKKSAAALFQNAKAIDKAMEEGATFGAVIRRLGNGAFSIQLDEKGKEKVQGTPRGLFTSGTMRIHVGQLVIVEGASATRPWEIVALIDEKSTADALVKRGRLSAKLVGVANAAGAVEEAEAPKEDIFLPAKGEEDFWTQGVADVRGGLKAERKAQEEAATISARVATLKGSKTAKKGVDGGVAVGSLADPLLFSGEELHRFKRWRAHKAKMAAAAPAPSGGALVPAPLTEEDLRVQFKAEAEAARLAAEFAAAATAEAERVRAEAARAALAAMPVKENWDDIDLEDL